ncbi:MAG: GTPase, partial [Planctomycetota bacterium]
MSAPAPDRVALLTAPGAAGVAVLEVRGSAALARLRALAGAALPGAGAARLARLVVDRGGGAEELLDEALLVARPDGAVEAHLHGSPAVVAAVRGALAAPETDGARGTRRTLEARMRAFAAAAPTVLGARLALAQIELGRGGDGSVGPLRARLLQVVRLSDGAAERAHALLSDAESHERLYRSSRVALTGPVNAGKSTLLNLLAGTELALVSDVPGTTRDTVVGRADVGGWPVVLVDTAGERSADTSGAVERAGQALAREVAGRADLELRIEPARVGEPAAAGPPVLRTRAAEALGGSPDAWPEDAIAAVEFPEHAARRVGEALRRGLGLVDLEPLARWLDGGPAPPPASGPGRSEPPPVLDPDTRAALVSIG